MKAMKGRDDKIDYGILKFKEPKRDTSRKIIHLDMDAFYASVEIREDPSLSGKPVIIGRHPKESGGRGVVATASYEARKYGVHSAMSSKEAYELCPDGIFVDANFSLYREISKEIHEIFQRYTDIYQPLSLDEAYLDVTENKKNIQSSTLIARSIQQDILKELRLTSSAGVSYNKFLAKIASDYKKPAGLTYISANRAHDFLMELPIGDFPGVGEKTLEKMKAYNIYKGKDLYGKTELELSKEFGKLGHRLFSRVRGIDNSEVKVEREPKSIGKERTFQNDITRDEEALKFLNYISSEVFKATKKKEMHGKTVVLKVRFSDFTTYTRRKTMLNYIETEEELASLAHRLWQEIEGVEEGIRLLGVTMTNLDPVYYENIPLDF
ncbi:MAG: DNA polymerase IV [Atopostipes suicloacalis]|nr:DNA polymerase IV [Atopostipes suicloacalis]